MTQTRETQDKKGSGYNLQITIIVLFVIVMCVNFFWVYTSRKHETIEIANEKAEVIISNYMAAIEFAAQRALKKDKVDPDDAHQKIFNIGEAGHQFSELLGMFADFKIKMISANPRNMNNAPDDFEEEALAGFTADNSLKRTYTEATINGKKHLRYLKPLKISKNCLACHGEPKGKTDITGYAKEGYKLGEIRGAVSLIMPIHTEYKHFTKHIIELVAFYIVLTFIATFVFFAILKKMVDLNTEIKGKNVQLKIQHDMLKEYEEEKSGLIAMIVHDLRNPLTTIISGLEIITEEGVITDERYSSIVNLSYSNAKRLSNMISDILDINSMENEKFTPKYGALDVPSFMEVVINELRLSLGEKLKFLELNIKDRFPVFNTDQDLLRRIIENIVFNAVKHSQPKLGEIKVNIAYNALDADMTISISDNGEGIPKEQIDKIFDKFYQVEGHKQSAFNKGLGLTFCKFAVNALGGRIWVESELGEGATFNIVLKNHMRKEGEDNNNA